MNKEKLAIEIERLIKALNDFTLNNTLKIKAKIDLAKKFQAIACELIIEATSSTNIKLYNEATIHLNYAINIAKKLLNDVEISGEQRIIAQQIVSNSNKDILTIHAILIDALSLKTVPECEDLTSLTIDLISRKKLLINLRVNVKEKIDLIQGFANKKELNAEYIRNSKELFDELAQSMKVYLLSLTVDAVEVLGPPPCRFELIGLGSMALRQMTPYSDLEFAFLTENNDYKAESNPDHVRNYFKNLAHYLHFRIICLGETVIPFSYYNVDLDQFINKAVSFDLGGKTPLGRFDKDKEYDLICTIEEMLSYLRNDYSVSSEDRRDNKLSYLLENTCFIGSFDTSGDVRNELDGTGDITSSLVLQYQQSANAYLSSAAILSEPEIREIDESQIQVTRTISIAEQRAVRILKGKTENPNDFFDIGNLERFRFDNLNTEGRKFDVKLEIYRVVDRLIYGLGIMYNLNNNQNGLSCYDILENLQKIDVLSKKSTFLLKKSVAYANMLRLRLYNFYQSQKDEMDIGILQIDDKYSIISSDEIENELFFIDHNELSEEKDFFDFYYVSLTLHHYLNKFIKSFHYINSKVTYFNNLLMHDNSNFILGEIYTRIAMYKIAIEKYELALNDQMPFINDEFEQVTDELILQKINIHKCLIYNKLAILYNILGELENSEIADNLFLEFYKQIDDIEYQKNFYNYEYNRANTLSKMGRETEALEILQHMLNFDLDKQVLIKICLEISTIYIENCQLSEAQSYLDQANKIFKESIINNIILECLQLTNQGQICFNQGNYKLALKNHFKAVNLYEKYYSKYYHALVDEYNYIGRIFDAQAKFKESCKYFKKAFNISIICYGQYHFEVSKSCSNYATSLLDLEQLNKSKEFFLLAIKIDIMLNDENYLDLAFNYNLLSNIYMALGEYIKAKEILYTSLKIQFEHFGCDYLGVDSEYTKLAYTTYANLASIYNKSNICDLACAYYLQAKTLIENFIDSKCIIVGHILEELGEMYIKANKLNEGLDYLEQALKIYYDLESYDDYITLTVKISEIVQDLDKLYTFKENGEMRLWFAIYQKIDIVDLSDYYDPASGSQFDSELDSLTSTETDLEELSFNNIALTTPFDTADEMQSIMNLVTVLGEASTQTV